MANSTFCSQGLRLRFKHLCVQIHEVLSENEDILCYSTNSWAKANIDLEVVLSLCPESELEVYLGGS